MKDAEYAILIAKPDTWFDAGTEVFIQDLVKNNRAERIDEFALVGIQNEVFLGYKDGVLDGEFCPIDEFTYTFTKEKFVDIDYL